MLTCFLSYHEIEMAFFPKPEDMDIMKQLGPLELVVVDRTLIIAPGPKGILGFDMVPERNAGLTYAYTWSAHAPRPMARFCRHEVEVSLSEPDTITIELPADHLSPWPKYRHRQGANNIDFYVAYKRELYLRCKSAFATGGKEELKRTLQGVPSYVASFVGPTWTEITDAVMTGKELQCMS